MASHDKATHVDHTKSMILKPLLSGAFTFIFNKYLLNEQDMTRNLYLSGSVALATSIAPTVTDMIPVSNILPSAPLISGKTIELRAVEIGGAAGISELVNLYVLGNARRTNNDLLMKQVGVICLADICAESTVDILDGSGFTFLK
jgi:hypothetical protein